MFDDANRYSSFIKYAWLFIAGYWFLYTISPEVLARVRPMEATTPGSLLDQLDID